MLGSDLSSKIPGVSLCFMAKKQREPDMTDLNAEISTDSMRLLKLARLVQGRPVKNIVQEAIDTWLAAHGITRDKLEALSDQSPPRRRNP